jgi:hypothetical protein
MLRLLLIFVFAVGAFATDWTVNEPEIADDPAPKLVSGGRGPAYIRVRVRFLSDDETPPWEKDYEVMGLEAMKAIGKKIYPDQLTLQGFEGVVPGPITPIGPTPRDEAIESMQGALRSGATLNRWVELWGWADTNTIGTSGITVSTALANLENTATENIVNAATLTAALEAAQ